MATNQSIPHKLYSKAPLPFVGQKRNFIKAFRQILTDHITDDGEGWTIVDVFGGSGLLAHNAKHLCPKATVIYNDYDDYAKRLQHVADTERLRQKLHEIVKDYPHNKPLPKSLRAVLIEAIESFDGYVDVACVTRWLLFSGKQVASLDELFTHHLYNNIRRTPLATADGYLDGLEIVSESYTRLMPKYFDQPKTLLLLDPPYLYTQQKAYQQDKYFAMIDFLYLMSLTRPPYIFFSSTKSELLEYMDYLKYLDGEEWQRLGDYQKVSLKAYPSSNSWYEDNMIYRF